MVASVLDRLRSLTGLGYDRITHVFDIEETRRVGRWPVIWVLPFLTDAPDSCEDEPGPGVGALLANLARRDLLVTRHASVLGVEDTPKLPVSAFLKRHPLSGAEFPCDILLSGVIRSDRISLTLDCKVSRLLRAEGDVQELRVTANLAEVGEFTRNTAKALCAVLGIEIDRQTEDAWTLGRPLSWETLCETAACLEGGDVGGLLKRFYGGRTHADALLPALEDVEDEALEREAFRRGVEQDARNPQLLFNYFCKIWNGRVPTRVQRGYFAQRLSAPPGMASRRCVSRT